MRANASCIPSCTADHVYHVELTKRDNVSLCFTRSAVLGDQLKEFLKSEAEYFAAHKVPFYATSEKLDLWLVVDLEITSEHQIKHSDKEGYFKNRSDIAATIQKAFESNLSSTNIFTIDELLTNLYSKKNSKDHHKNFVYLIGDEGSGKRILVETLLKKYSEKELLNVEYVFFIQCRYVKFNQETTLIKLLATNLPHYWICDESITEDVLEILHHSDKMLIIIEDLYLAQDHFLDDNLSDQISTAEYFIKKILMRTTFPKAQVLVTTHLYSFYKLSEALRAHQTVEVLNLSTNNQFKICEKFSSSHISEQVHDYINGHVFLKVLCGNLEYCSAVVHIINVFLSSEGESLTPFFSLPLTRVTVAAYALLLRSKNLRTNVQDLEQLSNFAWSQIKQGGLKTLSEVAFPESQFDVIHPFVNAIKVRENKAVKAVQQFHFLWLEILAAFYCAFYMTLDVFKNEFLPDALNASFQNPMWFVAIHVGGLFDDVTLSHAKRLFPSTFFFSSQFEDKSKMFKQCIYDYIVRSRKGFSSALFSSCIAHSMQDENLATASSFQFGDSANICGNVYSTDLSGLYFALQNRMNSISLRIASQSIFVETPFLSFLQALTHLPQLKVNEFKI